MNEHAESSAFIALVDDDEHSAHLLTRMLLAHGAPEVRWYGAADPGAARLVEVLADPAADWPSLLIVDLKSHSRANLEFVSVLRCLTRQKGVPVVVMTAPCDRAMLRPLQEAGVGSVFFRHAELDAYRREAAGIVGFWARSQRLDAVGM
ncbi:MAG TPA: hypothetical protein VGN60_10605 [Devosia sp.]|nr:hypothetical protein [Devosia sp.]